MHTVMLILVCLHFAVEAAQCQLPTRVLLPHARDSFQYVYSALDCSDDHNCIVLGKRLNKVQNRYVLFSARTTDGGDSWSEHDLPYPVQHPVTGWSFWAVSMPDSLTIVGGGDSGLVATSTDGGVTWGDASLSVRSHVVGSSFRNSTDGMVSGFKGLIAQTTDGGTKWTVVTGMPNGYLRSIHDFGSGDAAVLHHYEQRIYRTHDGWATYDTISPIIGVDPDSNRVRTVHQVYWTSATSAFGAGMVYYPDSTDRPLLVSSTDAGASWQTLVDNAAHMMGASTFDVSPSGAAILGGPGSWVMFRRGIGQPWEELQFDESKIFTEIYPIKLLGDKKAILLTSTFGAAGRVLGIDLDTASAAVQAEEIRFGTAFYPNPANQTITISAPYGYLGPVRIIDILGRTVKAFDSGVKTEWTVDLRDLPTGIYSGFFQYRGRWLRAGKFAKQ